MSKSQASNKVKPTPEAMILSISTMLLWWDAERLKVKQGLDPGWKSKYDVISECIADIQALLENWGS